MSEIITSYLVESYAAFCNVDQSILSTNIFIEKYGYQFVAIDLPELEKNFSNLFFLPKKFESDTQVIIEEIGITVSHEFYKALTNHSIYGHYSRLPYVIFLKKIEDFNQKVVNNTIDTTDILTASNQLNLFTNDIIHCLRLFKNGDVSCPIKFMISKEKRAIMFSQTDIQGKHKGNKIYSLPENESSILLNDFKTPFSSNKLTELALSNFNLSYEISDIKTKYITLMTCLESLFNQGKDQITHTVSRHLSLIVSNSEKEFQSNYHQIKELYSLRSKIVHGSEIKVDIFKQTDILQDFVRKAINYCLKLNFDKKEFFDELNVSGFKMVNSKKNEK